MEPTYKNYEHYIKEKSSSVKKSFLCLDKLLSQNDIEENRTLLDVGCAAGELIKYLHHNYPEIVYTGIDIFDDLLNQASLEIPNANFVNHSILNDCKNYNGSFDFITVFGVLGVFNDKEIELVFNNILSWLKPGGRCFIFEPFNNYGMDLISKHRKRINGVKGDWELGNSVYSIETIEELITGKCGYFTFHEFDIGMELKQSSDPQRTWTINCNNNPYQLTNGLKLLFDMYLLEIIK